MSRSKLAMSAVALLAVIVVVVGLVSSASSAPRTSAAPPKLTSSKVSTGSQVSGGSSFTAMPCEPSVADRAEIESFLAAHFPVTATELVTLCQRLGLG